MHCARVAWRHGKNASLRSLPVQMQPCGSGFGSCAVPMPDYRVLVTCCCISWAQICGTHTWKPTSFKEGITPCRADAPPVPLLRCAQLQLTVYCKLLQGMPAVQESLDLLKVTGTNAAQAVGWGAHAQWSQQAPPTAPAGAGAGPGHAELWSQAVQHLQDEHEEVSLAGASACCMRKGWKRERPLDVQAAELALAFLAASLSAWSTQMRA